MTRITHQKTENYSASNVILDSEAAITIASSDKDKKDETYFMKISFCVTRLSSRTTSIGMDQYQKSNGRPLN